jgi:hypothetical protein
MGLRSSPAIPLPRERRCHACGALSVPVTDVTRHRTSGSQTCSASRPRRRFRTDECSVPCRPGSRPNTRTVLSNALRAAAEGEPSWPDPDQGRGRNRRRGCFSAWVELQPVRLDPHRHPARRQPMPGMPRRRISASQAFHSPRSSATRSRAFSRPSTRATLIGSTLSSHSSRCRNVPPQLGQLDLGMKEKAVCIIGTRISSSR